MFSRIYFSLGVIVALVCISCDKVPLLAPTNSTLSIAAQSRIVPLGGSTEVRATVIESAGTPVQNGTVVRFSTTLGRVDPVEAQTRNGVAVTTFIAGNDSGVADVSATSGGAGGATSTTTPPTPGAPTTTSNSNMVQISVGSAAVETVTVRVNPSVVSANGGTVTVIASVVGLNGRQLEGMRVSFSATRGTLSSPTSVTDATGEAQVTLTTNADTDVTATAGTKTSTAARVTAQPGPSVSLTCAVGAVGNCATVSVGQSVIFTAQRAQGSSNLASATLDFGDGTSSVNLGQLSSPVSVPHTYTKAGTFTARLTATDINGETTNTPQVVEVSAATVTLTTTKATLTVTATATVSAPVTQYQWDFGDGATLTTTANSTQHLYAAGTYTLTVVATLQAGGTVSANTVVVLP